MKILRLISFTILICLIITSCKNDDNNSNCDQKVIVSLNQYNTAPNSQLIINSVVIIDDCLKINYGSSGCNGESWELKLIDSEAILESNPIQRNLRLSLKNEELCDAFFTKEITFNIHKLQTNDGNQILLNLLNFDNQILYEY